MVNGDAHQGLILWFEPQDFDGFSGTGAKLLSGKTDLFLGDRCSPKWLPENLIFRTGNHGRKKAPGQNNFHPESCPLGFLDKK